MSLPRTRGVRPAEATSDMIRVDSARPRVAVRDTTRAPSLLDGPAWASHTPSPIATFGISLQSTGVPIPACAFALPRCPSTERRITSRARSHLAPSGFSSPHTVHARGPRESIAASAILTVQPSSFAIAPCTPAASHFMLVCPCPVCTAPFRADNTAPACAVAARLTWRPCLSWRPRAWFPSRAVWGAPRPAAVRRARRARQRARPHGAGPPLQSIPHPP